MAIGAGAENERDRRVAFIALGWNRPPRPCGQRRRQAGQVDIRENPTTGFAEYTFTCVRCLSYGTWAGMPEMAKIGK